MFSGGKKQQYFHLGKEEKKRLSLTALYCLALGELNRYNQLVCTSTAIPLLKYLSTSISTSKYHYSNPEFSYLACSFPMSPRSEELMSVTGRVLQDPVPAHWLVGQCLGCAVG